MAPGSWWIGILLILIGSANWWTNRVHFKGTLYHNALAGETRKSLERAVLEWTVSKPTEMRTKILAEHKVGGPESSIREKVHAALSWVPLGVIALGVTVVLIVIWRRLSGV